MAERRPTGAERASLPRRDRYAWRWINQVGRQLWSFGRDQAVGLILAVLILVYQLHSGLIQSADVQKTGAETIAYPYLTLIGLYVLYEILRAPFVLNREQENKIRRLAAELQEAKKPGGILGSSLDLQLRHTQAMERLASEMSAGRTESRLRQALEGATAASKAYSPLGVSALAALHERGKKLFETKVTSNGDFETWKAAVDSLRQSILGNLTETDEVIFNAPFSNEQRTAGHSGALNRIHGDTKGELLVQLERLRSIMVRHAT